MNISNLRFLNRDSIKYIAVFAMLLNHISYIFMKDGTFLAELFENIGYITAITMCYFLVEGYYLTRSKKKYASRLFFFAVISELPFCLALTKDAAISFVGFNMLFTLLICFAIIYCHEHILHPLYKQFFITILILLSAFCDWSFAAPAFTLFFIRAREGDISLKQAFLYSTLLYGGLVFILELSESAVFIACIKAIFAMTGPLLAAILILYFYNDKATYHRNAFSKWFFYLFYPLHLLILGILRLYIK